MAPKPHSHDPKQNRFLRRAPNSGSVAAASSKILGQTPPATAATESAAARVLPKPRRRRGIPIPPPPKPRIAPRHRGAPPECSSPPHRQPGIKGPDQGRSSPRPARQPARPSRAISPPRAAAARCCCCWSYRRLTGGGRCARRVAGEAGSMRAGLGFGRGGGGAGVEWIYFNLLFLPRRGLGGCRWWRL